MKIQYMIDDVKGKSYTMSAENLVFFHWPADAYVVLSYAAVSNYSHDTGERALEETRSFTGPQVSMRCYLKRQY